MRELILWTMCRGTLPSFLDLSGVPSVEEPHKTLINFFGAAGLLFQFGLGFWGPLVCVCLWLGIGIAWP